MGRILPLDVVARLTLHPKAPYHFDSNFHKPSHFPSSDVQWEPGKCWITMRWQGKKLGLKFENAGTIDSPRIRIGVYSESQLSDDFLSSLIPEIRWRFNFDQDISAFCNRFRADGLLGPILRKLRGMKPVAANSLYETLMVYLVLQNATVRRTTQMLEALFNRFGGNVAFDGKVLSVFWTPQEMARSSEDELRELRVGYRPRYFTRITEQFAKGLVNEFALRRMPKEQVADEMRKLYGVGPATLEYLLFEDFYFLDGLETIPPWEQKIMSRLLFNRRLVSTGRILRFFKERYPTFEKLAFDYLWEDLFWRRKYERIEWLEREIRL